MALLPVIELRPDGRVRMHAPIPIPASAGEVWRAIEDIRTVACLETFHGSMTFAGPIRAGQTFTLRHAKASISLPRVGRILSWKPGVGYAFSDLSARHRLRGFPHVFSLHIEQHGDDRSTLHFRINGRWTARWVPRPLALLWLSYLFHKVRIGVENHVLRSVLEMRGTQNPAAEHARRRGLVLR